MEKGGNMDNMEKFTQLASKPLSKHKPLRLVKPPLKKRNPESEMTKISQGERIAVLETKVDELKDDFTLMRKENREDHARVIDKLEKIEGKKQWLLGAIAVLGPILMYVATHVNWGILLNAPK